MYEQRKRVERKIRAGTVEKILVGVEVEVEKVTEN